MDACRASSGRYCHPWSCEYLGLSPHCASTYWVTLGKLFYLSLSFLVCKMVMLIVASPWSCGKNMCLILEYSIWHTGNLPQR